MAVVFPQATGEPRIGPFVGRTGGRDVRAGGGRVGPQPDPAPARRARQRRRAPTAAVELEIDGVAVKIARGADAGAFAAVIEALKATRCSDLMLARA